MVIYFNHNKEDFYNLLWIKEDYWSLDKLVNKIEIKLLMLVVIKVEYLIQLNIVNM